MTTKNTIIKQNTGGTVGNLHKSEVYYIFNESKKTKLVLLSRSCQTKFCNKWSHLWEWENINKWDAQR